MHSGYLQTCDPEHTGLTEYSQLALAGTLVTWGQLVSLTKLISFSCCFGNFKARPKKICMGERRCGCRLLFESFTGKDLLCVSTMMKTNTDI